MILVDHRTGSYQLVPHLLKLGLEVQHQNIELEFGDVAFEGYGPVGEYLIGIERKTIGDLITCMTDGRFTDHQLPGMLRMYQERYLMVEGMWKCGDNGEILQWRGKEWRPFGFKTRSGNDSRPFTYRQMEGFLWTVRRLAGFQVIKTRGLEDSALQLSILYAHCRKKWDDHNSFHKFYTDASVMSTLETEHTLVRRVAKEFPGVGWKRSKEFDDYFDTVIDMVSAGKKQLEGIPGIGKTLSERIYKSLRERKK